MQIFLRKKIKMFYRTLGKGEPIIILHGLYGMSDNWLQVAKKLQYKFKIFLPDLRNHGNSVKSDRFDYQILIDDLLNFMNSLNLSSAYFIGHSLGGRIVLLFAQKFLSKVRKAVIVDIPPRNLTDQEFLIGGKHKLILQTLASLDLSKFSNRKDLINYLSEKLQTPRLAFFLAKNIKVLPDGSFGWKLNLKAILNNLDIISDGFDDFKPQLLNIPILFVKGENSPYITQKDIHYIETKFPNAKVITVEQASHWLHYEKTEIFVNIVLDFFK